MKFYSTLSIRALAFTSIAIASVSVTVNAASVKKNISTVTNADVVIGQRFDMYSKVLGESRRYLVHTPNSYYWNENRYPVLVVLDADVQFQQTVAAVEFLAVNGRIPAMIVVGITNTHRQRDMTPKETVTSTSLQVSGGADKFLSFIADELLPSIDMRYRTHPYRVLSGHSLGGLFAMHSLQTRPEVFKSYLAVSSSLWWDKQAVVNNMESFLKTHPSLEADVYLTLDYGQDDAHNKFSEVLTANAPPGLRWKFVRNIDEIHNSNPYRSTYEGLQQLFDGYYLRDPVSLYQKSGLAGLEAHYASVSKRLGFAMPITGVDLEPLLITLMEGRKFAEVDVLLQRMIAWAPNEQGPYFAATMIYPMLRNDARAIESAKKWLELAPGSSGARDALARYKIDVTQLVPEHSLPKKSLAAVIGSYANPNVTIDIALQGDKLFATSDAGTVELKAISDTQFYLVDSPFKGTFQMNKAGKPTGVLISHGGNSYLLEKIK